MVTADLEIYPGGFPEPMYSTVIKILIKIKIKIKNKEMVKVIFLNTFSTLYWISQIGF